MMAATSIWKQYGRVHFIVGVVVTSDLVSYTLEIQSDSVCRRWVTDRLNLYKAPTCKILTVAVSVCYCFAWLRDSLPWVLIR